MNSGVYKKSTSNFATEVKTIDVKQPPENTTMHFSSTVERISGESAKVWEIHHAARHRQRQGDDVIILSVGEESAEPTPESIQEAIIASILGGRHH